MEQSTPLQFEVISATPSKNGGFVVKLKHQSEVSVETAFGAVSANKQLTYLTKMNNAPTVGVKGPLDLNMFDVQERPFVIPATNEQGQPNDNAGEIIQMKWLSPKLAK